MRVEANTKCPICKGKAALVKFHIQAGQATSELTFFCKKCQVTFKAEAVHYRIDPEKHLVVFAGITNAQDLEWEKNNGKYNPSARE